MIRGRARASYLQQQRLQPHLRLALSIRAHNFCARRPPLESNFQPFLSAGTQLDLAARPRRHARVSWLRRASERAASVEPEERRGAWSALISCAVDQTITSEPVACSLPASLPIARGERRGCARRSRRSWRSCRTPTQGRLKKQSIAGTRAAPVLARIRSIRISARRQRQRRRQPQVRA